jgi:hypothetical protein
MLSRSVGIVVTTTYLYDVNDERIAECANGSTTTYLFPIYNANGTTTTKHIFAIVEPAVNYRISEGRQSTLSRLVSAPERRQQSGGTFQDLRLKTLNRSLGCNGSSYGRLGY